MNEYQKAYLELAGLALTLYTGIRLVMYVIINS